MSAPVSDTVNLIVQRAEDRFRAHAQRIYKETDRIFAWLMLAQWLFGIAIAALWSPYGWEGKTRSVHAHVYTAVFLGAALSSLPIFLAWRMPGATVTRHVVTIAQMLWSALLIHLSGGRIETHFHVFGSLGFISYYRDWRVLLTATLVVAGDHLARGMMWPESVYGIANPEWWRFLEHAFWVAFCNTFLTLACIRGVREMREVAEREAQIEAMAEGEWLTSSVVARDAAESKPT